MSRPLALCMTLLALCSCTTLNGQSLTSQRLDKVETTLKAVFGLPVGTILGSVLPPVQFARGAQLGSWVPADGRSVVSTTKFAQITGKSKVPDLRGLFLRGLNAFASDNPRTDQFKDPDGREVWDAPQEQGTRMPSTPFKIASSGVHTHQTRDENQRHSHTATTNARKQEGPNRFDSGTGRGMNPIARVTIEANTVGHTHNIASSGTHDHEIAGGDEETRPSNLAIYYYIRVN